MQIYALLGATASGKTSHSIVLAKEYNAYILSLDSLSIYRDIDIVSAKPTLKERAGIEHFGIDIISPCDDFNVRLFFDEYQKAYDKAYKNGKNLLIVGGTGFYLKSMITGISVKPRITQDTTKQVEHILEDISKAYKTIKQKDEIYANKISQNDKYRIEKWYEIYLQTNKTVSEYFQINKPIPLIKEKIKIYNIDIARDILKQRITQRTHMMIDMGLIDEIKLLEQKYTRNPKCFGAIGIKETLSYIDGEIDKDELIRQIISNTNKLAKRQRTFNKTQFQNTINI